MIFTARSESFTEGGKYHNARQNNIIRVITDLEGQTKSFNLHIISCLYLITTFMNTKAIKYCT